MVQSRRFLGYIVVFCGIFAGLGAIGAQGPGPGEDPFEFWLASSEAGDLDGDGDVDKNDFDIWMDGSPPPPEEEPPSPPPPEEEPPPPPKDHGGHPSYDEWISSSEAHDANGDGKVDDYDYEIVFYGAPPEGEPPPPPEDQPCLSAEEIPDFFNDWVSGPEAYDVDNDGDIDGDDFKLGCELSKAGGPPPTEEPPPPSEGHPSPEDWLASDEAHDVNGDGTVDELDYEVFFYGGSPHDGPPPVPPIDDWLASAEAHDVNGDGTIDDLDYEFFFFGPPPGEDPFGFWLESPEAGDMDGDGDVDEGDFKIWVDAYGPHDEHPPEPHISVEEWLASADAHDVNGDDKIDEKDYELYFFGPLAGEDPYAHWVESPEAMDIDEDGDVDEDDFKLWVDEYGFPGDHPPAPPLEVWLASDEAHDANGDGAIDEYDYEVFFFSGSPGPPVSVEEWLAGDEAHDVNGDDEIDELDYEAYFFGEPPVSPVSVEEWLASDEAHDANADGVVDEFDYEVFFFGGPYGYPELPSLDEWLASDEAYDVNDDGTVDEYDYELLLESIVGPHPLPTPEEWLASEAAEDLNEDGQIDMADYELLAAAFDPEPSEFLFGLLDGVDLEERLLFIDGTAFEVAEGFGLENYEGEPLEIHLLVKLAGGLPFIEARLNDKGQIEYLIVESRIEIEEELYEFAGPVRSIDGEKLVFVGPLFAVTDYTTFFGMDNSAIEAASLVAGQLVSIHPGAPDIESGSPHPVAQRIQVVDPHRPPPPRTDLVSGQIAELSVPGSSETFIELSGPAIGYNADTEFSEVFEDVVNELNSGDIAQGDMVHVLGRAPLFGEALPQAVKVQRLGDLGIVVEEEERRGGEIKMEGYVDEVDPLNRYLALRGEVLDLDPQVVAFASGGQRITLEHLAPEDLLEMDTRPAIGGGFAVTRIQVVDPASHTFGRPGVLVGSFAGFGDGQLFLGGAFFSVPEGASIHGRGGLPLHLGDLPPDAYVLLAVSPPQADRNEILPVAFDIREVAPPQFPVEIPGAALAVIGTFPEDGDVEISTHSAVKIGFNGPVFELFFDETFLFEILPVPSYVGPLEISADGTSISAEVELLEGETYQLVVLGEQIGLTSIHFTTGNALANSGIFGAVQLPAPLAERGQLVPAESFAVLLNGLPSEGGDVFGEGLVVAGNPLEGTDFRFGNVVPGEYYVAIFVGLDIGRGQIVHFDAFFDGDGDGNPDRVEVPEGAQVQVDIGLQLKPPLEVVGMTPAAESTQVPAATQLVIRFNQPSKLYEEDVLIFPQPRARGSLGANADRTVYTVELELAANTVYSAVVENAFDDDGGDLADGAETFFTTGESFVGGGPVSGRVVLPPLAVPHRFTSPILVGLLPAEAVGDDFDFDRFDPDRIVASTITFSPDFLFENVPPGPYRAVAFAQLEVPQGFRPEDPRDGDFDLGDQRDQRLEVFDSIELFGLAGQRDIEPGSDGVEVFLRGQFKTRDRLLFVEGVAANGVELALGAGDGQPPVVEIEGDGIVFRFNKALRADRGFAAIEVGLNGQALRDFSLVDEGKSIRFAADLAGGQLIKLTLFKAEARDGSRLEEPLDFLFSTGAAPVEMGSIAGRVELISTSTTGDELSGEDGDQIDLAKVVLFELGAEEYEFSLVGAAEVGEDGRYLLDQVVPGVYRLFTEVFTASGQEVKAMYAGEIEVLAGGVVEGVDLWPNVVLEVGDEIAAKTAPPGGNEAAVFTLDLDPSVNNQNQSIRSEVAVGQEVTVDLYVNGVDNLTGVAAKFTYDADILKFVKAEDAVADHANLLRRDEGLAIFLAPLVREPQLEFGGAILGPVPENAPEGGGFIARFTFLVQQEFEGAQVFLDEVLLKSTAGEDVLHPELTVKLAPLVFEEQKKGIISFDFDTESADQEQFHRGFVEPGSLVEVDVYFNMDKVGDGRFADLANYSVTAEYDPQQLSFVSYAPSTTLEENIVLAAGGSVPQMPPITKDGSVNFGHAILGPTAATSPDAGGLVARLVFLTSDSFTQTDLLVTGFLYKSLDGPQYTSTQLVFGRLSSGEIKISELLIGGETGELEGGALAATDFDGDGKVDFPDFFPFADAYDKAITEATAKFDLNQDGLIDFLDFFIFADNFGKRVIEVEAKPVAARQRPLLDAGLVLKAQVDQDGLALQLDSGQLSFLGYGAVLEYDQSVFALAQTPNNGSEKGALRLSQTGPGWIALGSSTVGEAEPLQGVLAQLRFEVLQPELSGVFRLRQGVVRQLDGQVVELGRETQIEGRWAPPVFALEANYPNPFNPTTTIGYQVPSNGLVQLKIYDILGQLVRVLVDGNQVAGAHRVLWNSRDDQGHLVGAGVYFYTLRTGQLKQTRKLILIK